MRLSGFLLCLIAAVALLPAAQAADSNVVKLVTGNDYHPYTDKRLPEGGLATQIVKATFEAMGFETEIEFLDWQEGYDKAKEGYYLATFPYVVKPERKRDFAYTTELFLVRPYIFWNVERKFRVIEFSDLYGKSLCVPKGWAVDLYLQPFVGSGDIKTISAPTMRACFERLKDGSADLASVDRRLGVAMAKSIEDSRWVKSRRFVKDAFSNHLLFTRAHPQADRWAKEFDRTFNRLRDDGTIYELIKAYYAR